MYNSGTSSKRHWCGSVSTVADCFFGRTKNLRRVTTLNLVPAFFLLFLFLFFPGTLKRHAWKLSEVPCLFTLAPFLRCTHTKTYFRLFEHKVYLLYMWSIYLHTVLYYAYCRMSPLVVIESRWYSAPLLQQCSMYNPFT